jgi:hydroxyethylthiazole kinase-like uncharacterized protein yjeF
MADPLVVTPAALRGWPLPDPGSDKEARGQLLVVGGTQHTTGAARLAGEAALRVGAGKLAVVTVEHGAGPLAVSLPEAQVIGLPGDPGSLSPESAEAVVDRAAAAHVVLVGPGFADPAASVALLERVLPRLQCPLVVDALGSAYLTEHPEGLHHLDGSVVLTVNPEELAHTAGDEPDRVARDPLPAARRVADRARVVVVCGGTRKHVVTPSGDAWVVEGGGPGLGVSGSGDVQAGIVAGLLARGAEPAQAGVWGAYTHARAGERLAADVGTVGFLARELPDQVPAVLSELH